MGRAQSDLEFELMYRLAENGDRDAMRDLLECVCDAIGEMLPIDRLEKVQDWLTMLAEEGDEWAELMLGTRYYSGKLGFPQDFTLAREWYEKAAAKGNSWALCNLGYVYAYGRGVEIDACF
jgi:TPR repeat protein